MRFHNSADFGEGGALVKKKQKKKKKTNNVTPNM